MLWAIDSTSVQFVFVAGNRPVSTQPLKSLGPLSQQKDAAFPMPAGRRLWGRTWVSPDRAHGRPFSRRSYSVCELCVLKRTPQARFSGVAGPEAVCPCRRGGSLIPWVHGVVSWHILDVGEESSCCLFLRKRELGY